MFPKHCGHLFSLYVLLSKVACHAVVFTGLLYTSLEFLIKAEEWVTSDRTVCYGQKEMTALSFSKTIN